MPASATPITLASLNSLDWFLLIVVGLSTLAAFRKGIIRVLFSIAGFIAALLLASWNYLQFAVWLRSWVANFAIAQVIAFLAILVGVMLAFTLIASFVAKSVAAVGLGFLDRLLGAAFGLLRGALFGAALLMAIVPFVPEASWLKHSMLAPYFLAASHGLSFVVPRQLQEQMAVGTAHLLQQTPELVRH